MLKLGKVLALGAVKSLGGFALLGRSRWRRSRLLVIAYHGVSQDDEHLWNPELYLSAEQFRARMTLLRASGCNVLPLAQALRGLSAGDLPDRSVVLTFDDGFYSFYQQASPILKEFGWPATVYLTSYYSAFNRPVFDVMCSYLLWKGGGRLVGGFADSGDLDLRSVGGRAAAELALRGFARERKMSAEEKDRLLTSLADRLGVDYGAILEKRILHLLSPAEVARLSAEGVDIQLHTHRHCSPLDRRLFLREVGENRSFIAEATGTSPSHFCYPSGTYDPRHVSWLREAGVASAVTGEPGLATRHTDPLTLPRLTDTTALRPVEFEGWLCGFSSVLPRRTLRYDEAIYPHYYERSGSPRHLTAADHRVQV